MAVLSMRLRLKLLTPGTEISEAMASSRSKLSRTTLILLAIRSDFERAGSRLLPTSPKVMAESATPSACNIFLTFFSMSARRTSVLSPSALWR